MKKYGANALTVLRVLCTPLILFVTNKLLSGIHTQVVEVFILFAFLYFVICSSDYFDGKIARKYGIVSRFGAILDLAADFSFVVFMHIVMILHGIIPAWFMIVIIDRFFNFIITSKIENDWAGQSFHPRFDNLGKYISAVMYIMPFIMGVDYCFFGHELFITNGLVYGIAGISVITSYSRIRNIKSAIAPKANDVNKSL
ncbi:CDP-alcohol phosphatidyltransferase family protein [Anaerocolumna sp. AGMB13020]|uniref:CDP-alcohol phosphatidyltransferase family protein n=1 Tax=Anaerocolumna sp. AGMB13020 TaxID=3081750 RepID=UPI0029535C99|nr:CDP-alcohol phosphatidyltransferase family protein [Anaerocolumna sp. AGMB13020]WOO37920.1 CDP-alcohol phosphatidyltransferase family protein [Anaerocolumna sp. AGMB13020]